LKGNVTIALALLGLALIPVTCTFVFSGDDEGDAVPEYVSRSDGTSTGPVAVATTAAPRVPVFKSFEKSRYQEYDRLIAAYVADYNANRAKWAGSTPEQAAKMPEITAAQVKAHMIQESGGGDVGSRAAWAKDPLQVNVPGDWNPYKKYLGLRQPRKRNEGSLETNLKAGIMLLARKGYGVAGQPAANNRKGSFDGWPTALRRYNGRTDKAADGRPYSACYAERILDRAKKGEKTEVEIPIKTKKK